ncbi:hypothetical protein I7I53_09492 [Histoplasma capsulatum var. duboisii H88]|uniref:Uncharacterized protein n=1 Tax=Ajellomyces capsulatus (strain H88) TaxID=544711 RepID=A0A8A1L529_AJEC8|nr:hypothetical protein I7I53_09492 [Histoplasma capsulatum var. duboisii H88]
MHSINCKQVTPSQNQAISSSLPPACKESPGKKISNKLMLLVSFSNILNRTRTAIMESSKCQEGIYIHI